MNGGIPGGSQCAWSTLSPETGDRCTCCINSEINDDYWAHRTVRVRSKTMGILLNGCAGIVCAKTNGITFGCAGVAVTQIPAFKPKTLTEKKTFSLALLHVTDAVKRPKK